MYATHCVLAVAIVLVIGNVIVQIPTALNSQHLALASSLRVPEVDVLVALVHAKPVAASSYGEIEAGMAPIVVSYANADEAIEVLDDTFVVN